MITDCDYTFQMRWISNGKKTKGVFDVALCFYVMSNVVSKLKNENIVNIPLDFTE